MFFLTTLCLIIIIVVVVVTEYRKNPKSLYSYIKSLDMDDEEKIYLFHQRAEEYISQHFSTSIIKIATEYSVKIMDKCINPSRSVIQVKFKHVEPKNNDICVDIIKYLDNRPEFVRFILNKKPKIIHYFVFGFDLATDSVKVYFSIEDSEDGHSLEYSKGTFYNRFYKNKVVGLKDALLNIFPAHMTELFLKRFGHFLVGEYYLKQNSKISSGISSISMKPILKTKVSDMRSAILDLYGNTKNKKKLILFLEKQKDEYVYWLALSYNKNHMIEFTYYTRPRITYIIK